MRMKSTHVTSLFLLLAATVLMAGCGSEDAPGTGTEPTAVSSPSTVTGQVAKAPSIRAVDELVTMLTADGSAKLRYDRQAPQPDSTGRERQVYLEMLDIGVEEADRLASDALARHEYRELRRSGEADDVHLTFGKQGRPELRLRIRSRDAHPNLTIASARSSLYVTYVL